MKILVLGTGALATLFAARLAADGVEVTMLGSWPEGLSALNRKGARLDGVGNFHVRAVDHPVDRSGVECVFVLVKSWQTERAARQLAGCLAPHGVVITLQNGLGNEAVLSEILGKEHVFRGVTTLGATLLAPGLVRLAGEGTVTLPSKSRLFPWIEVLRHAGFDVQTVGDIQPLVWAKLVINAVINPLTALLRVKNGVLLESPSARDVMGRLANEAAAVASACGVVLPFDNPEKAVEEVAHQTAENMSSMLQDVLRGVPTEVDFINGAVCRLGGRKRVPVPVNWLVWCLVKAIPVRGKI
jgi:2-dehydropantoate 2-reductase